LTSHDDQPGFLSNWTETPPIQEVDKLLPKMVFGQTRENRNSKNRRVFTVINGGPWLTILELPNWNHGSIFVFSL
jgi:hypothetical protein